MKVCDRVVSSEQPERCGIYSFDVAGQVGAVVNQSECREWCEADVRCNYYAFWSIGWCADDHPSTRAYCIRRLRQSPVRAGHPPLLCCLCSPQFLVAGVLRAVVAGAKRRALASTGSSGQIA